VPQEIERKFLVSGDFIADCNPKLRLTIVQGYFNSDPNRTVRIRLTKSNTCLDLACVTIKGPNHGISRAEYEFDIVPADAALELINNLAEFTISKHRHMIVYAGNTWCVDQFLDNNTGLILAEIELETEDQTFELPPWVGREVSDDVRYYNLQLAQNPYKNWSVT